MTSQYAALITAWSGANAGSLPGIVTSGSAFQGGDTTIAKLNKVNAWVVTGQVPAVFFTTGDKILNGLNWAEFQANTPTQQTQILALCTVPGNIQGGASSFAGGMILSAYSNRLAGPTITNFTALAKATVQSWWQIDSTQGGGGFSTSVTLADVTAAGLS